eukprot:CAMPEP_0176478804 /NCGR_PEP_ID=MMETSP0200_2-20121128/1385_1 /TAXON_ID=947934 /ORGANISM="Chaetoceros sp., Strain GSL56" /LENGTH=610 /DNA_ID=CAMNT_0017874773 /DNA_START=113 /DNA_END=1946 /DNA_ORIENTATION=+
MTRKYSHMIASSKQGKLKLTLAWFLLLLLTIFNLLSLLFVGPSDVVTPSVSATVANTSGGSTVGADPITLESPNEILLVLSNFYKTEKMDQPRVGIPVVFGHRGRTNSNSNGNSAAATTHTTLTGRYLYPCPNNSKNAVVLQNNNDTKKSIIDCHVQFPFVDLSDYDVDEPSLPNGWSDGLSFPATIAASTPAATAKTASTLHTSSPSSSYPSNNDYAVLTKRGYKGGLIESQVNQDRPFIFHNYYLNKTSPTMTMEKEGHFVMGIMDGHGTFGHLVAQFVLMEFIRELLLVNHSWSGDGGGNNVDNHDELEHDQKKKWMELYQRIDSKLPKDLVDNGGCTASVIAKIRNDTIIVANTGDSQTFIVGYQRPKNPNKLDITQSSSSSTTIMASSSLNVTILYKTKQHKAHIPEEMKRIESAGGIVEPPRTVFGTEMSSRVLVPIADSEGAVMSLAMSRSFGDALAKAVGVIVDPTVDVLHITELRKRYQNGRRVGGNNGTMPLSHDDFDEESIQMFAVSVSDGLFDQVAIEEIAQVLALGFESDDKIGGSLYKACEELIEKVQISGWNKVIISVGSSTEMIYRLQFTDYENVALYYNVWNREASDKEEVIA